MIDDTSVRIGTEAFVLLKTQMDRQNFGLTVDDLEPEDVEETLPYMREALGHVYDHLSYRPEVVEEMAKVIFAEMHYTTPWEEWTNKTRFLRLAVGVIDLARG